MNSLPQTITFAKMPHCPPGQFVRANATDVGIDLMVAEDCIVKPISMLPIEWQPHGLLETFNPEVQAQLLRLEHLGIDWRVEKDEENKLQVFRKKIIFPLLPTGIKIYPNQLMWNGIFCRSGSATKYNTGLANAVGVIDYTYHRELFIAAYALHHPMIFRRGERVAQLIPMPQMHISFEEVELERFEAKASNRGGFGSSGMMELPSLGSW